MSLCVGLIYEFICLICELSCEFINGVNSFNFKFVYFVGLIQFLVKIHRFSKYESSSRIIRLDVMSQLFDFSL